MSDPPMKRSAPALRSGRDRRAAPRCARRPAAVPSAGAADRTHAVVDAVRKALHHERAIGDDRQDERRHRRVVAQQIALGQLELRPEQLGEVGDPDPRAIGQGDRPVPARVLELAQFVDDGLHLVEGLQHMVDRRLSASAFAQCSRGPPAFALRASARQAAGPSAASARQAPSALSHDAVRLLVVAQAEIDRVAQDPVVGPLREADLRDELGPDPVRGFVAGDLAGKRRLLRRARLEQLRHALELALG